MRVRGKLSNGDIKGLNLMWLDVQNEGIDNAKEEGKDKWVIALYIVKVRSEGH